MSYRVIQYDGKDKPDIFKIEYKSLIDASDFYELLFDEEFETESGCAWAILNYLDGEVFI